MKTNYVFGIFYLMTQNNSALKRVAFIAYIFAYIQFWSFAFIEEIYKHLPAVNAISVFLTYLQFSFQTDTVFQFYAFNILACFVVIVVLLLSLHVGQSFKSGIFTSLWSVRLLRLLGLAFLSVLFIPTLQLLLNPLNCISSENLAGHVLRDFYPEVTLYCYHFPNVFSVVISLACVLIIVPFACFLSLVFFNANISADDILARPHGRFDFSLQIFKILLVVAKIYLFSNSGFTWSFQFANFLNFNLSSFVVSILFYVFFIIGNIFAVCRCYRKLLCLNVIDARKIVKNVHKLKSKSKRFDPSRILSLAAGYKPPTDLLVTTASPLPNASTHPDSCLCTTCASMVGIFKSVFDVELSARFYLNKATSVIKQEEDLDELEAYIDELIACGIVVFIHGCQSFSIANCRDYAFISLFFKSSVGQLRPAWSNQFLEMLCPSDNQFETHSSPIDLKFLKFVEERETVRTQSATPKQQGLPSSSPSQMELEAGPSSKMGIVEYLDFQRLSFQARKFQLLTIEELRRFWYSLLEGSTSGSVTHIQRLPAISSRIVEFETEASGYFDSLITRFSYNPVVYRQAAQFARDVLADESLASKLESSGLLASAPAGGDGKSVAGSGAGSVANSIANTNSDGSILGNEEKTAKETLLVGDSSHDGISNKARFYLRLLSYALISSAILLFLLHSTLITSYQDHISAHDSITKLNYQTGFVQALGSVSSSRYDLLNFTVLSESSRTIRDLLPVAFRRSSSVNKYWRTSVKDLIDIDHHLDFSRFSLQLTFYDMFREISREVLNVQSLTEPNQITLFKDLSNLFEFYLSPGFDTLLKQLTPDLQSSRLILSVFVLSLLIFCLALSVITFVKLVACFNELNQNRASAMGSFLEIDRSIAQKELKKYDDIAKRSGIQGNYSSKFDAMSNRTELSSAARAKMLSGEGVSSSKSLKDLKKLFVVTLTSVVTIVLVFSLLFFNQMRVTNPMMENFEDSNSLVTQNSLIFSNSMTNSSNTHSYLNHVVFKLNNLLSGHLVLDASSSFCSPDTFNLNDFDLSIPSYTTLLSLESEASDFYFSPTSCVAVNDSTCPSLTNPELFSLYYYNWFFLAQSCHSGAPSLFLSVYTSLFQSSTLFSGNHGSICFRFAN
ncbi:hypothetical protein GEMRC1_005291 [Eukaryota sp. GEM-RC1]